jgi:hypothetical protein
VSDGTVSTLRAISRWLRRGPTLCSIDRRIIFRACSTGIMETSHGLNQLDFHFIFECRPREASRKSAWVQGENRIVKAKAAFPEKVYEEIDFEADLAPQLDKLLALGKRSTVFLSYAIKDKEIAARMRPALEAADFRVLMDVGDLSVMRPFDVRIDDIICQSAQTGYALILLSRAYLTNSFAEAELRKAIEKAKLYRPFNCGIVSS